MLIISENTVRFAVDRGFFVCGNDVFDLPLDPIDKLTYLALTRYADSKNKAWPAYNTLAKDVSCSKNRAITAVNRLVACKLVVKVVRGNRSNNYYIYPPEYFCEEENNNLQNIKDLPTNNNQGVNDVDPQGQPDIPSESTRDTSGSTSYTLRVNEVDPINNKISTIDQQQHKTKKNSEESSSSQKQNKERNLESIRLSFKKKGTQVTDNVINKFLSKYKVIDIQAAIECTDFDKATNPIAVIHWMLSSGNYVIAVEKEKPVLAQVAEAAASPGDEAMIMDMRNKARAGLLNKTAQEVPA